MLTDTTIIQRRGPYAVQAEAQGIRWPDGGGEAILHQAELLHANGAALDSRFLRALRERLMAGTTLWTVFDLRHVAPSLADDLPPAFTKDIPGLVYYTLRHRYPNAGAFYDAVARHGAFRWMQAPALHFTAPAETAAA